ncbi:hypothetical protein KC349_g3747 [Hortaea werneckii]|nr:hypothetical protein KC349_g3747 [Hortaea werneckii]
MPFAVVVALFERVYLAIQYPTGAFGATTATAVAATARVGPGRAHEGPPTPPPPSPEPPLIDLDEANVGGPSPPGAARQ